MKKGIFKKILATILTVAIVGSLVPAKNANVVSAATTTTDTISSNQTITKTVVGGTTSTFIYTMPKKGYFSVSVTPISKVRISDGYADTYYSIDYEVKQSYRTYVDSYAYDSYGTSTTDNFSFAKGSKVYINVQTSSYSSNYNYTFQVRVNYTKAKNYETESNGNRKNADKIAKVNKKYSGNVSSSDVDYWVFTAPKSGKYAFKAVNSSSNSNAYAYANTYKGYKKTYYWDTYLGYGYGYKKISILRLRKGQKIYVQVRGSSSHSTDYKLIVVKR